MLEDEEKPISSTLTLWQKPQRVIRSCPPCCPLHRQFTNHLKASKNDPIQRYIIMRLTSVPFAIFYWLEEVTGPTHIQGRKWILEGMDVKKWGIPSPTLLYSLFPRASRVYRVVQEKNISMTNYCCR